MNPPDGSLSQWRDRFKELDRCPWPGPAPLTEEEGSLLVGRAAARAEFDSLLNERNVRLILLHAPSGAGKSSLLEAGLKRELTARGAVIKTVNRWGGVRADKAGEFLAQKLELPGDDPFERFGELGASGVLILDQFEELVRYSPSVTRQMFAEILRINKLYKTKIIVSFRSEYLHDFTPLEQGAVNFSVHVMPIGEIEDRYAEAVVRSGNKRKPSADHPDVVDDITAKWLAKQWTDALDERKRLADVQIADADPFDRVGLLHLQALVYSLYFSAEKAPLGMDLVTQLLRVWEEESPGVITEAEDGAIGLTSHGFRLALGKAVDSKLAHCVEAGEEEALVDSVLSHGTRWMIERTVPHLSSAGYKLIRSANELAELALGADARQLRKGLEGQGVSAGDEAELFGVVLGLAGVGDAADEPDPAISTGTDLLNASRLEIAAEADGKGTTWRDRLARPRSVPHENDPSEVTAGVLFGQTPTDVLIEEFRRFAFGLVWLEESSLVRVTTPVASQPPMISLIHDGFGTALIEWAANADLDPEGPLAAITAPRGFAFGSPRRRVVIRDRALSNLRWQGGVVERTDFHRVAFLNCDFQGLEFRRCHLSGVTFVNCLLDGAVISDCEVSGPIDLLPPDSVWSSDEPDFVVAVDGDLVPLFRRYRDLPDGVVGGGDRTEIYCDLPGAPAIPFDGRPPATHGFSLGDDMGLLRLEAPLVEGGVAVYGGRVSNLVVRRCELKEGSGLAIRHGCGSGLDLVEIPDDAGHLEVFGSSVRHLTLSAMPGAAGLGHIDVHVANSMLAQTFVGTGLSGRFDVAYSILMHAWNASPTNTDGSDKGVHFVAKSESLVYGGLDIELDETSGVMGSTPRYESADGLGLPDPKLSDRLSRMDYRRNPARFRAESRPGGQ